MSAILGIDIAKKKFDAALLRGGKFKTKVFDNSLTGFTALTAWLTSLNVDKVHICMEATGNYYESLALYLSSSGHLVSVVNPFQIKSFGQSMLSRTKTDKADARLIAKFCEALNPPYWEPDPPEIRTLRDLGRRREALINMRTQEMNREPVENPRVIKSIRSIVETLDNEIEEIAKLIRDHINNHPDLKHKSDLLRTIPGVGDVTIEAVLSEVNGFEKFTSAAQVVSYMGLSPREKSSGSSVRGRAHICKTGNKRLRKVLFMPAMVAIQRNPAVKALYDRLKAKSKNGFIIACACMRKLMHIIFGVIKNNKPFDPYLHLVKG